MKGSNTSIAGNFALSDQLGAVMPSPKSSLCASSIQGRDRRHTHPKVKMPAEPVHQSDVNRPSYRVCGSILFPQENGGEMGDTKHLDSSLDLFETMKKSSQPTIALPKGDSTTVKKNRRAGKRQKKKNKKKPYGHKVSQQREFSEIPTTTSSHTLDAQNIKNVVVEQHAHKPCNSTKQHPLTAPATSLETTKRDETFSGAPTAAPRDVFTSPTHKERLAIQLMEKIAEMDVEVCQSQHALHLANSLVSPSFPSLAVRVKVTFVRVVAMARREAAQELAPPALQSEDVMTAEEAELFLAAFSEVRDAGGRVLFRRYFRITEVGVGEEERGVGAVAAAAGKRSHLVSAFENKKARLDGLRSADVGSVSVCLLAEVNVDGEGRGKKVRWIE